MSYMFVSLVSLVSISSLVGLVHLCFELVLAPEILVMIEDHRRRGWSMGFLFCPVKGANASTLISRFQVEMSQQSQENVEAFPGDGQLDSIFQVTSEFS